MQELYEGVELSPAEIDVIARGLLDLAAVDGVHESEIALIDEFYRGSVAGTAALTIQCPHCSNSIEFYRRPVEGGRDLDALRARPFDLDEAAAVLRKGGDEVVEAFLVSAYLLIYADGEHSDAERVRIKEFADALGVSADRLEDLHLRARLYLLQTLAKNLKNKAAVQEVGASLGLAEADIASVLEG